MFKRKTLLSHCILAVLFTGCPAAAGESEQTKGLEEASLVDSQSVTVSEYCTKFAARYSESNAMEHLEHSVRTEKKSDVMMRVSNLFQPPDSRFTSGYDCHFQMAQTTEARLGRDVVNISVDLLLTKTLDFAEYTKWKDLQIIPIEHVVDEISNRSGYGVFKYLEKS